MDTAIYVQEGDYYIPFILTRYALGLCESELVIYKRMYEKEPTKEGRDCIDFLTKRIKELKTWKLIGA